jgi:hypothetical protein
MINKVKKQHIDGEKLFASYSSNRELYPEYIKNSKNFIIVVLGVDCDIY